MNRQGGVSERETCYYLDLFFLIQSYKMCFSSGWNVHLVSTLEGPTGPETPRQPLGRQMCSTFILESFATI